jgi:hypothetical protein
MKRYDVIIDRAKWGTGSKDGGFLYNTYSDKKCCLGFICEQVFQVSQDDMALKGFMPIPSLLSEVPEDLLNSYKGIMNQAATINDSKYRAHTDGGPCVLATRESREEDLLKLFADTPFNVMFVGES